MKQLKQCISNQADFLVLLYDGSALVGKYNSFCIVLGRKVWINDSIYAMQVGLLVSGQRHILLLSLDFTLITKNFSPGLLVTFLDWKSTQYFTLDIVHYDLFLDSDKWIVLWKIRSLATFVHHKPCLYIQNRFDRDFADDMYKLWILCLEILS